MCAGCDFDALVPLFFPMGDGDNGRNAEIARDIKRPDAAARAANSARRSRT